MPDLSDVRLELEDLERRSRLRRMSVCPQLGGKFDCDGRVWLNFSSNDYLNLATDPRLKAGAQRAIEKAGCGATASRLMAGHTTLHALLESRLAALMRQETALVFSTGYQANVGTLTTLAGPEDVIVSDALNHASIVDGARLSRAHIAVYRHCDVEHAEELLRSASGKRRRVLVSDSVFSMDGDLAPVAALAALAKRYDAWLVIDEAHALGVFGNGVGVCHRRGVQPDVVVGTLSKAFGSMGGFVAAPRPVIDLLINRARSFIYTTGIAPPCLGSALAALDVMESDPRLGSELLERAQHFQVELARRGVPYTRSQSQIIPIILGPDERVMASAAVLHEAGVVVTGVRPPTVPEGTARLRLSVTLAHTREDLTEAAAAIGRSVKTG